MRRMWMCSGCVALVLLTGCVNETIELFRVEVTGEVESAAQGTIYVTLHHAFSGQGVTRHPLGPIETLELSGPGPWSHTFEYPLATGEGLVVYMWQDVDGDGALCAPDAAREPSGLTALGPIEHEMRADVRLEAECLGAERLYP